MLLKPNLKSTFVTYSLKFFLLAGILLLPLGLLANQPVQAKRHTKAMSVAAQVTAFELEPPANPDYPAQLCGKRRERLVELQTMPWVVKPFFLGQRRVEQWQYRLCLTKTMPEVQRYLESFPVPYTVPSAS